MKVFVAHDDALRVRIGKENLGSESLGPWYVGTGAIRLRQVHGDRFRAYRLDAADTAARRPSRRPSSGMCASTCPGRASGVRLSLDVDVPEDALAASKARAVPLRTRLARLGKGAVAMFGDFQTERAAGAPSGLFHLGGDRLTAFRTGFPLDRAGRGRPAGRHRASAVGAAVARR